MTLCKNGVPARKHRRGISLAEVAIGLSIFFSLSFGTVEFGYYFYCKHMLANAAAAGAWVAGLDSSDNSDVTTAVNSALAAGKLANSGYTVTTVPADVTTAAPGTTVTVTVSCTWGTVAKGFRPLGFIPSSKTVSATAVALTQADSGATVGTSSSSGSSGTTSSGSSSSGSSGHHHYGG